MSTPYDQGKAALDELIDWAAENVAEVQRNEATTRLHLVDQLLTKVLAWPLAEIETETAHEGKYVDYSIGRPFTRLIVEAKREGQHFSIPAGLTSTIQRLSNLTDGKAGEPLKAAAEQVAGYCASRGVSLAVVCNGLQIVAFLGVRTDGVPPLKGNALVFPSLSAMRENFRLFWDNLSKPGIEARNLHVTLKEGGKKSAPAPLSASIPHYPGIKRRNDIQVGLQILAELFLEDLTRTAELEEEFLRATYATSGALSQYAMLSKQILENRYSLLHESDSNFETEPAAARGGSISPNLAGDILASGLSKRPIILLGDVGVGKTMFIRHLVNVDAKEVFQQSVVFYVDFGQKSALMSDLREFVIQDVIRQFREKYDIDINDRKFVEAVHHGALNRFDKGIYGELREIDEVAYRRERLNHLARLTSDSASHLLASMEHLRGSMQKQIVIFLDNIDQHASELQEQVFLIAQSLASEWPATVFVSLRPDTFYRSRSEGTLSAYQPRVFTIAPPRVDVVLKKRTSFALNVLKDPSILPSFNPQVTLESDSLTACLEVLLNNFERNDNLVRLIDNLSAGNTRLALSFVSSFIGSGHVDTRKIVDIYTQSGHYNIPLHEFLRATIYGDYEHYEPDSSPIANVFDISEPDGREHFLLLLVLAYVETSGDRAGTEGFVSSDDVYTYGQQSGFSADQIAWAVERAVRKGILERSPRARNVSGVEHIRVTSAGVYTARVLAGMFAYLDAVVVDTPIVDDAYRRIISDAHSIMDRLRRAGQFRAYLDNQWRTVESSVPNPSLNWREHSTHLGNEIARISDRLQWNE